MGSEFSTFLRGSYGATVQSDNASIKHQQRENKTSTKRKQNINKEKTWPTTTLKDKQTNTQEVPTIFVRSIQFQHAGSSENFIDTSLARTQSSFAFQRQNILTSGKTIWFSFYVVDFFCYWTRPSLGQEIFLHSNRKCFLGKKVKCCSIADLLELFMK